MIRKLDAKVIKQIAAGEVIQRPLNVVKELIENSIDAGAERIDLKIENGGYNLIRIEDDGCGIHHEDLTNACQRHFTSKIREFSDLMNISTFGFRGEALFSMSCCAHVTITSKTSDETKGYFAKYEDGELVGQIEPTYAIDGTIIEIRDLFYKDLIRIQGKSKSNDERKKIKDLITDYSVVYPHIAFLFSSGDREMYRSYGNSTFEVVLRTIYSCEDPDSFFQLNFKIEFKDKEGTAELFLSTPGNSKAPKHSAIFINGRLITNKRISQAIENVYTDFLARGCHPFFFCVLNIPPELIDVNIHPSKKEVVIDDESNVILQITLQVKQALQEKANQRGVEVLKNKSTKHSQKQIPPNQTTFSFPEGKLQLSSQISNSNHPTQKEKDTENHGEDTNTNDGVLAEDPISLTNEEELDQKQDNIPDDDQKEEQIVNNINNNDSDHEIDLNIPNNEQQIEPFVEEKPKFLKSYLSSEDEEINPDVVNPKIFSPARELQIKPKKPRQKNSGNISIFDDLKYEPSQKDKNFQTLEQVLTQPQISIPRQFRVVDLTSINNMKEMINLNQDEELTTFFKNQEFVGFIGLRAVLFKVNSNLYAFNLYSLLKDFMFQRLLAYFANYTQHRLSPPVNIKQYINIISNEEKDFDFSPFSAMLDDYFSISIQDGVLYSLPRAITGYSPSLSTLPLFLNEITHSFDWEDEDECLQGLLSSLSSLYSVCPEDEEDPHLMKRLQNEIATSIIPLLNTDEYKPSKELQNCLSFCNIPYNVIENE